MAELLAFSAEQVRGLTGLSEKQLRYWDTTEFFHPTYAYGARAFGRIYSFRDVVGLRVIAILRKKHKLSLQELRKVGARLLEENQTPWASLRLYVLGKRVFFRDPGTGAVVAARGAPQRAIEVALEVVADDVGRAAEELRDRTAEDMGQITRNRYVMHNSPVIAGTRVPTSAIWNLRQARYTTEEILREYPRLTAADVTEAVNFEQRRSQKRRAS